MNTSVTVVVSGENVPAEERQLKETSFYHTDLSDLWNIIPYAKHYRFVPKSLFKVQEIGNKYFGKHSWQYD